LEKKRKMAYSWAQMVVTEAHGGKNGFEDLKKDGGKRVQYF